MKKETDKQRASELAEQLATPLIRHHMAMIIGELRDLEADVLRVTGNARAALAQIDTAGRHIYDGDVQLLTPRMGSRTSLSDTSSRYREQRK
jgi:hypothetical protein